MHSILARSLSFLSGGATMILELAASRLLAPILGNSLYTWTAVIGVVLAGLSVGAYIGGRAIDKRPHLGLLQTMFYVSGASVCLMMLLSRVMPLLALLPVGVPYLATVISMILFFLPAVLLGALQPMIVKLSTRGMDDLGRSYGILSAVWSLGSIVGVFASGFLLIPILGTWKTLVVVAGILCLCGIALSSSARRPLSLFLGVLSLFFLWHDTLPLGEHVVFAKDTPYFHALIADADVGRFGNTRIFFLDIGTHSILPGTTTVPLYTDITRLFSSLLSSSSHTLVIGGGAYTMPSALARTPTTVDVFEIDPEVPTIAATYFSPHPKIRTHIGDARVLLRTSASSYDLIIGDAFNTFLSIPWHLTTKEFHQELLAHLSPEGVYAVNLVSPMEGDGSELYERFSATLHSVFPFVDVYAFGGGREETQNIVFVASLYPLEEIRTIGRKTSVIPGGAQMFESMRVPAPFVGGPILTDDHAPTDTLALPITTKALPPSIRLYQSVLR